MELKINFGNGFESPLNCNIVDHAGLESTEVDAFIEEYALRNGAVFAGGRHKARRLTFVVDFGFVSWESVLTAFKALYQYRLAVTRDGVTSYIDGIIDTEINRASDGGVNDPVVLEVSYLCPQPFFTRGEISTNFGTVTGGLECPFEFPCEFDTFVGSSMLYVPNESNSPAPFTIRIVALSSITNLKIKVAGEVQTLGALAAGEVMVLDTDRSTVTIDGANAFSQVSWNFPTIPAGGTFIELYDGSTLIDTPYATVTYTPIYERV